ncbi:MAG: hypothetical protein LBJ40_20445 [Delftia acidovorans]|jgi:hypothetical protein|nr:hypothetical protein [Delftia acidovorans]
MTTFRQPQIPIPFNTHKDDTGEWRFTDVKPEDVPAIDDFLEAIDRHAARSVPLSQIALNMTHDEKINNPGKLAPVAKKRVTRMAAEYFKHEQQREVN